MRSQCQVGILVHMYTHLFHTVFATDLESAMKASNLNVKNSSTLKYVFDIYQKLDSPSPG